MAYNTRGSRPIVVSGMSFRWRTHDQEPQVVVWHVLDAGVLTITFHDRHFDPTPGFVARAVEQALHNGWRTANHYQLELTPSEFRQADGFSNRSRTIALPGLDNLLDHEAEVLDAPDPEGALREAEAVLQIVFAPTFTPACVLTLWTEGDAGYAELIGVHDNERCAWLVEAEAEWIKDAIVSVRAAPGSQAGRMVLDGMPTRVTIRDLAGSWSEVDNSPEEGTPIRTATLAGWRIAIDCFSGVVEARDILEGLHPYVDPGTLPMERDEGNRMLRIFGAWTWPVGEELVAVLRTCSGPWLVDARQVTNLPGMTIRAVRQHLRKREVPVFWIADAEHVVPWGHYEDRLSAEAARTLAGREAVRNMVSTLDPRWRGIAGEELLALERSRVERANRDGERWLGDGWQPTELGAAEGWQLADEGWDWNSGAPEIGFLVDGAHAWFFGEDGRVLCAPLRG